MAPSTPLNTSTPRQEQSNVPNFDDTISSGNSGSVTATADQNIINHRTEEDEDDNDDDDDEHGWIAPPHLSVSIPLHARLHELDHILRCSICHSYMSIPASIAPCHHTFCSECIRVSLKRSIYKKRVAECPICRAGTDERSIVPNHSMGMVIEKFCDMKKLLKHTLKEERRLRGIVVRMESDDTEGTSVKDTIKSLEKHVEEGSKTEATSSVSQSLAEVLDFGANSANGAPITTKHFSGAFTIVDRDNEWKTSIHNHLAEEKSQQQWQNRTHKAINVSKPRPSTHYHGMKRRQFVALCQRDGLPASGTDRELRERHAEFVTMVNAECDAAHPRSEYDLRQDLIRRETARKDERAMSKFNGANRDLELMDRLKQSRKAAGEHHIRVQQHDSVNGGVTTTSIDGGQGHAHVKQEQRRQLQSLPSNSKISSGNKQFDKTLSDGFKKLIADARRRMKKENSEPSSSKEFADENRGRFHQDAASDFSFRISGDKHYGVTMNNNPNKNVVEKISTLRSNSGHNQNWVSVSESTPKSKETSALTQSSPINDLVEDELNYKVDSTNETLSGVVANPSWSAKKRSASKITPARGKEGIDSVVRSFSDNSTVDTSSSISSKKRKGDSLGNAISGVPDNVSSRLSLKFDDRAITGPWTCRLCTYLNKTRIWASASCEMCENKRELPTDGKERRTDKSLLI